MRTSEDQVLLERYARERSDEAFAGLVARHINLVYSAALRHVGNPHEAEEITQAVFFILAKKAGSLSSGVILSGWLYRTTRLTAANFQRQENRRKLREQEAYMQSIANEPESNDWLQVAPALDAAMEQLTGADHDAVVLRFFEGRNFRDVADRLGLSEDAAKKRVGRAVEKLRKFFTKRGITLSAVALSGVLSTNSVHAAPTGLAATLSASKLAGGAAMGVSTLALIKSTLNIMTWLKVKTVALVTIAVVLTAGAATVAITKVQQQISPPMRTVDESLPLPEAAPSAAPAQSKVATAPPANKLPPLSTILAETNAFKQTKELVAYYDTLSPDQIPGVLHEIQKMGGTDNEGFNRNADALNLLISRWTALDPKAAQAELATNRNSQVKTFLIFDIYQVLTTQDPSAALAQAQQLPEKEDRENAVTEVISTLAVRDPAQALNMLQTVKDDSYHRRTSAVFGELAKGDLSQATQVALQVSDPKLQNAALDSIGDTLLLKDPHAAFDWLNQLPVGKVRDEMQKTLVGSWNDIPAMTAYIQALPDGKTKADLVKSAARQLTHDHPQDALVLLKALPPSSATNEAVEEVVHTWSEDDPKAAGEFVKTLPPDPEHAHAYMYVAYRLQEKDPASALAWLSQAPDGYAKGEAYRQVYGAWAVSHPTEAAAYVAAMTSGSDKQNAVANVVLTWSGHDPVAASQWLTNVSNGQSNDTAYGNLAFTWARNDPMQASNWLSQLPTGSSRDAAVKSFSSQVVGSDPGGALQWAESISDAKSRQDQATAVLQKWMQADPSNASAALQKSSLPDDVKNQILQAKK